eukprot:g6719.t1
MSGVAVYQSGPSVFKKLVRLVARAFYSGPCPPRQEVPGRRKWERIDTRGLAIVILDNLTQQEWVNEESLAKELQIAPKLLLKALRYLEQERILRHESRKEGKRAKAKDMVIQVTRKELPEADGEDNDTPAKPSLQSYWAIDYPVFWNTLRLRFHLMRFKITSEVEDTRTVMDYVCPKCGNQYTTLDFASLLNRETGQMICEDCGTEVLEQFGTEGGTGKVEDRRKRRDDMNAMLKKLDEELKVINDVISQAKDVNPPDYGCLADWAYEETMKRKAKQDEIALGDPGDGPSQWDPSFDLDLNTTQDTQSMDKKKASEEKVLPPWMLKGTHLETPASKSERESSVKRKAEVLGTPLEKKKSEIVTPMIKIEAPVPLTVPSISPLHRHLSSQSFQSKKKIKISMSPNLNDLGKADTKKETVGNLEDEDIEWEEAGGVGNQTLDTVGMDVEWEDVTFDEEAARLADLESDIRETSGWTTISK